MERTQEIGVRIDAHQFGAFTERVEESRDLRASLRARAVVILTTHDRPSQGALGRVVVERDARVAHKACQSGPALQQVAHGFAEIATGQAGLFGRPSPDAIEHGLGSLRPQLPPERLRLRLAGKRARHEPLDA